MLGIILPAEQVDKPTDAAQNLLNEAKTHLSQIFERVIARGLLRTGVVFVS